MSGNAMLSASQYLQQQLARNPDWQAAFSHSQLYAEGELMQHVAAAIQPLTDHASVVRVVRQIRHREMARIAWRDLSGMADLEETLRDTSDVADALTDAVLQWCYAELVTKHGTPRSFSGEAQRLVVLGMGKLGGRELNFSSAAISGAGHGETRRA